MNEFDILGLFYDEMKNRGVTREQVSITMEQETADLLSLKLGKPVDVLEMQQLTDNCIANEWIERLSADPHYKYLSLTEAGLQIMIAQAYT